MRYACLKKNDIVNGEGICVSFWVQGCPHHCPHCHNPETWDFKGGKEFKHENLQEIKQAIAANGIKRNFSILGGEPLCYENISLVHMVTEEIRKTFPDIKIYIWTGYILEELISKKDGYLNEILLNADYLIDGRYEEDKRDITLYLRGSSNQRLIDLKETFKQKQIKEIK